MKVKLRRWLCLVAASESEGRAGSGAAKYPLAHVRACDAYSPAWTATRNVATAAAMSPGRQRSLPESPVPISPVIQ